MPNNELDAQRSGVSVLVCAVLCLLMLGAGFALGRAVRAPVSGSDAGRSTPPTAGRPSFDEAETLIEALAIRDSFERAQWLSTRLPEAGPEIIPEIEAALRSLSVDLAPVEYSLLIQRWALDEPERAYEWALLRIPRDYRDDTVRVAMYAWAQAEPRDAVVEMSKLPEGPTTSAALRGLVKGWFEGNRPGLVEYIEDLGVSFDRQRALGTFVRAMIQRDGAEAAQLWAEGLPDTNQRFKQSAYRQTASELTQADPALGVAWEEKHGEGPYGDTLLSIIGARWAVQDGPAAMAWLSHAEPGERRDEAVFTAFRNFRQRDREGMLQWVAEMGIDGVEPWFQPAVGAYTMALSAIDPAGAMDWAELIEVEQKRRQAQITIVRRWRTVDEAAAEAWVAESPLTEEERGFTRVPLPVAKRSTISVAPEIE